MSQIGTGPRCSVCVREVRREQGVDVCVCGCMCNGVRWRWWCCGVCSVA